MAFSTLSEARNVEFEKMFRIGSLRRADGAPIAPLKTDDNRVELVNQTIVEEVLQDLGVLDFGKGVTAESNIAIWRERSTQHPMCDEFAFEIKFKRRDELHEKAMDRGRRFFVALQQLGRDWLSLGTTKTGLVYRLKGNPPQSHE